MRLLSGLRQRAGNYWASRASSRHGLILVSFATGLSMGAEHLHVWYLHPLRWVMTTLGTILMARGESAFSVKSSDSSQSR